MGRYRPERRTQVDVDLPKPLKHHRQPVFVGGAREIRDEERGGFTSFVIAAVYPKVSIVRLQTWT